MESAMTDSPALLASEEHTTPSGPRQPRRIAVVPAYNEEPTVYERSS